MGPAKIALVERTKIIGLDCCLSVSYSLKTCNMILGANGSYLLLVDWKSLGIYAVLGPP